MEIPDKILNILDRLHRAGHQAYVVGGAIRDICLDRKPMDWDVATSAPLEKIKLLFDDMTYFTLKHGTVTLVDTEHHFEVTTFKGGINTPRTIGEDLKRRDFTINAMAYDVHKREILDPTQGKYDLSKKSVRAVGNPDERFQEDPLRLLRAIRLATELDFRIEPKTLRAIFRMAEQLAFVAQERIREELMKILMSKRPSIGFNLMLKTGLLKQVLPELLEGYLKRQNVRHRYTIYKHILETLDRIEPDPVLRLCALLHDIAKPRVRTKVNGEFRFLGHMKASAELSKNILKRLSFSNETIEQVTKIISNHLIQYNPGWSDSAVRRLIRLVGSESIGALISFRRADILAHGRGREGLHLLSELQERVDELLGKPFAVETRDLAIDGNQVMKTLGLSPGPRVGRVLEALVEKVTDQPELNREEKLIALLEKRSQLALLLDKEMD